uniref:non-specific serine/threonine protein kinase n=1 Tax=Physcomitrium patens TaxID=3218 RepID=A0A2K1KWD9_PHYPA|nr:hypothetical protein PHYPA_005097 [Physcomitrium patens]
MARILSTMSLSAGLISMSVFTLVLQLNAQPGFINIDCGANAPNHDTSINMTWTTDSEYTTAGINAVDESETAFFYIPAHTQNTIRKFPGPRNKSCYMLPVVRNKTYLVRAGFIPQNPPPEFDIFIEATRIKTVDSFNGDVVEVVLKATRDDMYVCLVRTDPSDVPYISSLELRPLDPGMYALVEKGYYLLRMDRKNFGADKLSIVRYPDDPFDRIWLGENAPGTTINTTQPVAPGSASNKPPMAVMMSAKLLRGSQYPPWLANVDYYVVLYFAEIDARMNSTSRRFDVSLDSKPWVVDFSILLASGSSGLFTTLQVEKTYAAIAQVTNLTFNPCVDSTGLPMLNAYESYQIFEEVQGRTFLPDAMAIENIKQQYNLSDWSGDPCFPYPYNWLACTLDSSGPRISTLNLASMNLSGPIATSIANLTAVTTIWMSNNLLSGPIPDLSQMKSLSHLGLQHNSLTGEIPQWLVDLPMLQELFLQDNHLEGSVPKFGNKQLIMNISGNDILCEGYHSCEEISDRTSAYRKSHVLSIVVETLGCLLVLMAIYVIYRLSRNRCNRHMESGKKMDKQHSFQNHTQVFSLRELRVASKNFSKKIGEGGFGPVYYGKLADGQEVAIKVSNGISKQGQSEFFTEVDLLSRIHHKNLVSLIGYCQEKDNQTLIYEYFPNGSLRDHLYGPSATTPLSWNTRVHIALDAAQGLEYLHLACRPNIIHRDVKSSNILLTDRMEAKVSDFGLSKLALQAEGVSHISTLVKGTAGYLDPEYYISQKLTVKSDVYSFGVVLLELVCGRPPISMSLSNPNKKLSITEVVRPHLQAGNLQEIVDPDLRSDFSLESMWKVIEIAMTSVEPKENHRPNMQEVVQELREAAAIEQQRSAKVGLRSDGRQSNASEVTARGPPCLKF